MTINDKLQRAIDCLLIEDVILTSIDAKLSDDVFPGINLFPNTEVSIQVRGPTCIGISPADDRQRVLYRVEAGVRVLRGKVEDLATFPREELETLVVATIETSFYAYYQIKTDGKSLDHDCLIEFGKHNVPFQLWPYWREIIHSACSRMCVPKVVLPTHRLKKSVETTTARPVQPDLLGAPDEK